MDLIWWIGGGVGLSLLAVGLALHVWLVRQERGRQ
jgi:hypothetical protein